MKGRSGCYFKNMLNPKFIFFFVFLIFNLGCDRGPSQIWNNTKLSTSAKYQLYRFDPNLEAEVNVDAISHDQILLTGLVSYPEWKEKAETLVKKAEGVHKVVNYIEINQGSTFWDTARDTTITTEVKGKLFLDRNIKNLNYSIRTVNGKVYVTGVSVNEKERQLVSEYARKVSGVKQVFCLSVIRKAPELKESPEKEKTEVQE